MAYLLDVNDPTKMYTKTLDSTGMPVIKSYTLTEDKIESEDTNFVTKDDLDNILDEKFDKFFKKYNNRSRNRNKNQNREVDEDA